MLQQFMNLNQKYRFKTFSQNEAFDIDLKDATIPVINMHRVPREYTVL